MTIWTAIESDDLDALIEELGTADINELNEEGAHAVHFAAAKDAIKCFKYLVDAKNISPYFAARSYNGIGVEKLKKLKGDVTEGLYTKDGWTAMHIAAKEGSLNVMKYLVEELNAEINDCTTSASFAIASQMVQGKGFLSALLSKPTTPSTPSKSPLYIAAENKSTEIIKYLTAHQAKVFLNAKETNVFDEYIANTIQQEGVNVSIIHFNNPDDETINTLGNVDNNDSDSES